MNPDSTASSITVVGESRYELPAKVALDAVRGSLELRYPDAPGAEWDLTHVRLTRKHVLVIARGVDASTLATAVAAGMEVAELWEGVDGTSNALGISGFLDGKTFSVADGREVDA